MDSRYQRLRTRLDPDRVMVGPVKIGLAMLVADGKVDVLYWRTLRTVSCATLGARNVHLFKRPNRGNAGE